MNSIVNTIKQNIIDEKLYGDEIEASIKNVTSTEALFKEVEPLYSKFCRNKNQDKLLTYFYGLMPKSTTLFNLADSRITNLVMIHNPEKLVSFHSISGLKGCFAGLGYLIAKLHRVFNSTKYSKSLPHSKPHNDLK